VLQLQNTEVKRTRDEHYEEVEIVMDHHGCKGATSKTTFYVMTKDSSTKATSATQVFVISPTALNYIHLMFSGGQKIEKRHCC